MAKITTSVTRGDMELKKCYLDNYVSTPSGIPVAYTYGGIKYNGLPKDSKISREFADATMIREIYTGYTGEKKELKIKAECIKYRDYPVVEWTVYFKNMGESSSEILSDVTSIDTLINPDNSKGETAVLVHNNGDFYDENGYTVSLLELKDGVEFSQSPHKGRSCDRAFPYQRILFDGFGMCVAIGWPAQWFCEYKGVKNGFTFKAGQQDSYTYLKPDEMYRTPRMTLMIFDGEETRGINIWRRWFNTHVIPRVNGDIIAPKLVAGDNNGGIEWTTATEQNQLDAIKRVKDNKTGTNLWWIDAGWYPCKTNEEGAPQWYHSAGTWRTDPVRFPNSFDSVGKAAEDAGMEFLVWFEPERVRKDTRIYNEHYEWLLHSKENENDFLIDFSNPECVKWLSGDIAGFLIASGIKCYRQDFNFEPLSYWQENDGENRKGMTENKYVQGYLAYWDYLLMNVEGLWIDSCASGGRRNDMETMRRSVPLHPTDYGYGYHHVNQAFRHTLFSWITYVRSWTNSWDENNEYYSHEDYYAADRAPFDNYNMVNSLGVITFLGGTDDKKLRNDAVKIWNKIAPMQLRGDFYSLTENHRDNKKWTVFQFDCPEAGEGAFQVLRNNQASDETITVKPFGFDDCCDYRFINEETGEIYVKSGSDINQNGIILTQPVRSGSVWFYIKII